MPDTKVHPDELVEWASFGGPIMEPEAVPYVPLSTGRICTGMDLAESAADDSADAEIVSPEDLEDSEDYLAVPDKRELGLGAGLAVRFARERLSAEDAERVEGFFARRGAYGRFKDLLADRRLLDAWHAYEQEALREALLEWCEDNGLEPEPSAGGAG